MRLGQVDPERHPLRERRWRPLVRFDPVVQRDHHEPRIATQRHAVAFDNDITGIERRGDPRGGGVGQALGHRQNDRPAIRLGEQADPRHRDAARQCRGQVDPAEQPLVIDMHGNAADRRIVGQRIAQRRDDRVTPIVATAQNQAAQPGIDRAQPRGEDRIGERIGRVLARRIHAALSFLASSSSARSMRTVEPVSSSTLRRRRWRSASGATRMM